MPSEGKSLLNVLLVDGDLRGLSNLLTEEAADWRQVVQPVPNYPGWSVLTAGLVLPDPPRLLGSERMKLADAALIAQHFDGIILMVNLNRVDRGLPAHSLERTNARSQSNEKEPGYGYGSDGRLRTFTGQAGAEDIGPLAGALIPAP